MLTNLPPAAAQAAIAQYHSVASMLEARNNHTHFNEVWETVGADQFYHALALAALEADTTHRCIKVAEFDRYHNFLRAEVIRPAENCNA